MVIAAENTPPSLRGRLSLWLLEVRSGVYAGNYNRRIRERIWEETKTMIQDGSAVLIWVGQSETGFSFECIGKNRREPRDFDGLTLVAFGL